MALCWDLIYTFKENALCKNYDFKQESCSWKWKLTPLHPVFPQVSSPLFINISPGFFVNATQTSILASYKYSTGYYNLCMHIWLPYLTISILGRNFDLLLELRDAVIIQFSCPVGPTVCNAMNHSTPGLPVHHQLPEFTQTHVHLVGDAIQPSHPPSSPFLPAFKLSQHQDLFKWVSSLHQVAKVLEFQLQHQSFQRTPRTDFL